MNIYPCLGSKPWLFDFIPTSFYKSNWSLFKKQVWKDVGWMQLSTAMPSWTLTKAQPNFARLKPRSFESWLQPITELESSCWSNQKMTLAPSLHLPMCGAFCRHNVAEFSRFLLCREHFCTLFWHCATEQHFRCHSKYILFNWIDMWIKSDYLQPENIHHSIS